MKSLLNFLSGKLNRWFALHVIWEWKTPTNSTEIANDLHGNLFQLWLLNCFSRSWIKFGCLKCSFFTKSLVRYMYYIRATTKNNKRFVCNYFDWIGAVISNKVFAFKFTMQLNSSQILLTFHRRMSTSRGYHVQVRN